MLLFTCHCSARCFRTECAEIPRAVSAKLNKMQFLCIAKRVTVNNVNRNPQRCCSRGIIETDVSKQAHISKETFQGRP